MKQLEHQVYRHTHIDHSNAKAMLTGVRKAVLGNKTDQEIFEKVKNNWKGRAKCL